jgi:aspartokinase
MRAFGIAGRADRRSENVPLLVQKYGGTSIADPEKILRAARRAIAAHRQGSQVVVVVSAGGDTTDDLIAMARQIRSLGVRPISAAHNAVGLAGESPVVGIDCLPT